MHDLRLVGIHDDEQHLLLTDTDGEQYLLPLDSTLRDTVTRHGAGRTETPAPVRTAATAPDEQLRPRDVQALLRGGAGIEETAERAGWTVEKVQRYAGPIEAERAHIAVMVQNLPLRTRARGQEPQTFGDRVEERLTSRGVESEQATWDAWKNENGRWSVVCRFSAGGRGREAAWLFDPGDRTLSATDDEARWLGEDEQAPGLVPGATSPRRPRTEPPVFDLEAEGGLDEDDQPRRHTTANPRNRGAATAAPAPKKLPDPAEPPAGGAEQHGPEHGTEHGPVDLVSAMRERAGRRRRSRRSTRGATTVSPTDTPAGPTPDNAQPREHLDVEGVPAPPHGSHPRPDELAEPSSASGPAPHPESGDAPAAGAEPDPVAETHDPVTGTADLFADQELAAGTPGSDPSPGVATPTGRPDAAEEPVRGNDPERPAAQAEATGRPPAEAAAEGRTADMRASQASSPAATPPSRPSKARKGRPAVPSWDDIMFGSKGSPSH